MIDHHPDDALLLAHAAGTLPAGPALVIAAHVELCAHCRASVRLLEAVGGALLESIEPELPPPDALARTLARIDAEAGEPRPAPAAGAPRIRAQLPDRLPWPRAMRGCATTPWRWLGPGMRWSRVTLPHDPAANVFLLRMAAGKSLPPHTHSDSELTQVLYGSFHDGRALFGRGDFDATDREVHHQPVVRPGGECICLASVSGKVLFDGAIARMFGSMVGM